MLTKNHIQEAIKATIDLVKPNNQDSPTAKRQQELRDQLASIRQQQQGFKASRGRMQEKINALDANIKARQAEQKQARSRVPFKSVEDIDREIRRLEMQVDSGTMKLADERRNLADISTLRKQRKTLAGFDEALKEIDELKSQLNELKKSLDNPEARSLGEKYTAIQKELDDIKAEQENAFKNLASLREERNKIHTEQQKAYFAVRSIKDHYFKARKAHKEYEDEAFRLRRERQKAERESHERERRRKIADKKLEEASRPAYTDEILIAEGLIRHFDPAYDLSALCLDKDKKARAGNYRAEVGRTVDGSNIKGVKIVKKDDREDNYFMGGTGGKKGKKGKKSSNASTPTPGTPIEGGKFNLSFGVIEDLSKLKVDPPMNQSDVPGLIEKLAVKIVDWKNDQQAKTAEVSQKH